MVCARAMAQEPGCLLLDEPASFMDIRHQVELYDLVRQLADDGTVERLVILVEGLELPAPRLSPSPAPAP